MFLALIIIFTVVPAVELALLIKVGTIIGVANTLAVIILTGVLGASLARMEGFLVLSKIQRSLEQGVMPNNELIDGVMILVGGIVLLTPGFITDAMGFLLLLPPTRAIIKAIVRRAMKNYISTGQIYTFRSSGRPSERPFDRFDDADFH